MGIPGEGGLPLAELGSARDVRRRDADHGPRVGFGRALVPGGIERAIGAEIEAIPGVSRPASVCVRPSARERPVVRRSGRALVEAGRGALA